MNNLKVLNSLTTIVLCDSWHLPMVAGAIFQAIVLDDERQMLQFWWNFVLCTNKCRAVNSMVTKFFYKLSILKSVNVGTCHLLGHGFGSFEWRTANVSILMKFHTRHKLKVVSSIVTIVFCDFRCLSNLTPMVKIWQIWQLAPVILFFTVLDQKWQISQFWWNCVLCTNWARWIQ